MFYSIDRFRFVATDEHDSYWILETKGQETEEVKHKDRAAFLWCENASIFTKKAWRYLKVPQKEFEKLHPDTLAELLFEERSDKIV